MKVLFIIIPLLVLGLILFGCCTRRGGGSGTGGTGTGGTGTAYDYSNRWAAKVIRSKEINSFKYEFSISGLGRWEEKKLRYSYCLFSLTREGEEAHCTGMGTWHSETEFEFDFRTGLSALDELQKIIDTHEIAKVNGTDKGSEGIPAFVGSWLEVDYASGERIFAANNKGPILSDAANIDIHDFFMELAGSNNENTH